jgi:hypothetical protein
VVSFRRHQLRDRPSSGYLLQLLIGGRLGTPTSRRPFRDHTQRSLEALPFQAAPEFGAIPTATAPLGLEER